MVTAHAGGAAILPCAVPYSAPKASISLKRRRAQEVGLDSIQLLTSGRFYVEGLQAKDSGVYRCLADNNVTESRTRSPFFRLRVEGQYAGSRADLDSLGQHYAGVCMYCV